ncbi:hypothetical protein JOM56_011773 [Amanita muscaria]
MKFNAAALFLWLGTTISVVSAVDISAPPSFDLVARATHNHTLYRRAVTNYDNGLYDRDLAEFDERDVDDFVKRALFDELDERDFDGDDINKRQAQAIIKIGQKIGEAIWKLVKGIKGQLDKEKNARGKYTSTLAGRLCGAKPQYNWLIIHTKHDVHWDGVRGKDWGHAHREFPLGWLKRTTGFEIYFGKSGKLVNKGDGGWLNWGFCGKFQRNGRYVTFFNP